MRYIIDGYNLLFALELKPHPIEHSREALIEVLIEDLAKLHMRATIVFDSGTTHLGSFPHLHDRNGIEIAFSPHGMCADRYILELIEGTKNPKDTVVVSDDAELRASSLALHAKTMMCASFLEKMRRKNRKKHPPTKQTFHDPAYDEELQRIFEERLE